MNDGLSSFFVLGLVIWGIVKLHKHFGEEERVSKRHSHPKYRRVHRPIYRDWRQEFEEDDEDEENF